jgi:GAF domain-containing protein
LRAELERVRLESETLTAVIALVTSSPDLERVLGGAVDLLTRATRCHACFVYLRRGERLRLHAASHVYAQLVGKLEFGVEEGLAGWVAQRNTPAFIRENALADPRTNYVPELEEERFQSMAAVPVRSREGPAIGVIVLHTVAPREFDDATLNVLEHTAPLLAGAIENAQLYEDARRRVQSLTELAAITRRVASVDGREQVLRAATDGARALLGCDVARVYELDAATGRLELVTSSPPGDGAPSSSAQASAVLRELLRRRAPGSKASGLTTAELGLELGEEGWDLLAVPVAAGREQLGVLVAATRESFEEDAEELLALIASQLAVALEKAELIGRLTEENIVRDLLLALEHEQLDAAIGRARDARIDLARPHVLVELRAAENERARPDWARRQESAETALRRLAPGSVCDVAPERLRALLPLTSGSNAELEKLDRGLSTLASESAAAIGRSELARGAERSAEALRESSDATRVARALRPRGGALAYGELGAYRYLVHVSDVEAPNDRCVVAVRALAAYDRRRGAQLLATLEAYLTDRSISAAARALAIHPNTLRQRIERIEQIGGLDLASDDLLALELAIKLARLHPDEQT